jgi:[acyl-carrier-protein] S-malonyltransferase
MTRNAIAFLFPGQGSQVTGMGQAFAGSSSAAKAVYEEANDALGFDLARLSFEGPEAELSLTVNTQPSVLTASVAAAAACAERGLVPDMASGHSLGEYSALVVAGALAFGDAVRLVRRRGELMQAAVPVGAGAMAALLGLELDVVDAICVEAASGQVLGTANINAPGQVVIAGHRSAVERAVALAAERGGRKSVMLPVSAPFHCALMQPAADQLAVEINEVAVEDPRIPVARNVDGGVSRSATEVKRALVEQVAKPVRWIDCMRRLQQDGASVFIEVGPGRVLTGLLKRTLSGAQGFSIEEPAGLEKALAALGRS